MTLSIFAALDAVVSWIFRRFWLIVTPMLLCVPVALAAALLLPRTYQATTLLLLQESTTDNPFARELRASETPADKLGALRALLYSDRSLNAVLAELHGPGIMLDSRRLQRARQELSQVISMNPSGPEFVAISYRDSEPDGMGRKLSIIVTTLLETLLSTELGAPAAPQLVQQRMEQRVIEFTADLKAFQDSPFISRLSNAEHVNRAELLKSIEERETRINRQNETNIAKGLIESATRLLVINQSTAPAKTEVKFENLTTDTTGPLDSMEGGSGLDTALTFSDSVLSAATLRQEVDFARYLLSMKSSSPSNLYQMRGRQLAQRLARSTQELEAWKKRFSNLQSMGLSFMRAPERIIVIDPPKDPKIPLHGRMKIFLAAIASGVALGIGLGLLADVLDRRVRTSERLAAASGVPVLAQLPALPRSVLKTIYISHRESG